jgi:hypothetical protein
MMKPLGPLYEALRTLAVLRAVLEAHEYDEDDDVTKAHHAMGDALDALGTAEFALDEAIERRLEGEANARPRTLQERHELEFSI